VIYSNFKMHKKQSFTILILVFRRKFSQNLPKNNNTGKTKQAKRTKINSRPPVRVQSALCGPGRHWFGVQFHRFLDAKKIRKSASSGAAQTPDRAENQTRRAFPINNNILLKLNETSYKKIKGRVRR